MPILANKHYVASLKKISVARQVYATNDVYDANGVKLWSQGKPIDERLWARLSERALQQPIEECIAPADPLKADDVIACIETLVGGETPIAVVVKPKMDAVLAAVREADFNSAELTMITIMRHGDRDIFEHACAAAATALALAATCGADKADLKKLVHAGILHDVGELYVDAQLFAKPRLSVDDQRQLLLHPALGAMVIREFARLDAEIAAAVEQSHERLDGSGYPTGLTETAIKRLAKPLLTAEAIVGLLLTKPHGLWHAAVGLRLIQGEFPPDLAALINDATRTQKAEITEAANGAKVHARLQVVSEVFERSLPLLQGILKGMPLSPGQRGTLLRNELVLSRCQRAVHSTGLSQLDAAALEAMELVELIEAAGIAGELEYRINAVARDVESSFPNGLLKPIAELLAALDPQASIPQAVV